MLYETKENNRRKIENKDKYDQQISSVCVNWLNWSLSIYYFIFIFILVKFCEYFSNDIFHIFPISHHIHVSIVNLFRNLFLSHVVVVVVASIPSYNTISWIKTNAKSSSIQIESFQWPYTTTPYSNFVSISMKNLEFHIRRKNFFFSSENPVICVCVCDSMLNDSWYAGGIRVGASGNSFWTRSLRTFARSQQQISILYFIRENLSQTLCASKCRTNSPTSIRRNLFLFTWWNSVNYNNRKITSLYV